MPECNHYNVHYVSHLYTRFLMYRIFLIHTYLFYRFKFELNRMKFNFFFRAREGGEKGVSRQNFDGREVFLTQQNPEKKMNLIREVCLSFYFLLGLVLDVLGNFLNKCSYIIRGWVTCCGLTANKKLKIWFQNAMSKNIRVK